MEGVKYSAGQIADPSVVVVCPVGWALRTCGLCTVFFQSRIRRPARKLPTRLGLEGFPVHDVSKTGVQVAVAGQARVAD